MFTTSLIPLNTTLARTIGLEKNSIQYGIKHITPSTTYRNLGNGVFTKIVKEIVDNSSEKKTPGTEVIKLSLVPAAYLERVFYLTRFSFQSVPIIVLLPTLVISYCLLKERKTNVIFVPILACVFTVIYIVRVSHQRYLYPFTPFYLASFTIFLQSWQTGKVSYKTKKILFYVASLIFLILMLFPQYNEEKKMYEIVVTGFILLVSFFLHKYNKKILVWGMVGIMLGNNLFINVYAFAQKSQLSKSLIWGINGETKKIANMVDKAEIIYVNHTGIKNEDYLSNIYFYRSNSSLRGEFKRELLAWIPKKHLLKEFGSPNTYQGLLWETSADLKGIVEEKNIDKVVMVASLKKGTEFYNQNKIEILKKESWLELKKTEDMKNKRVYVFGVKK